MIVHKALAEMIGVFAIVFAGFGSIFLSEKFPALFPGFSVALVFGSAVCLMILAVGSISGAHFNPVVTLAFVAAKRLPASHIWFYWGSQFIGGLAAVALLTAIKR